MATWAWILIAIAAVVVVVVIALAARQRRTAALRQHFGPEYDRAVEAQQDRRAAEAELRGRERRRAELDIKPLPESTRARYAQEWEDVQERFVDEPSDAVVAADQLVYSVMEARGYPMGNFDEQASLVSVDHPEVVDNYRVAHGIKEQVQTQRASTEDLREALLRYRSLFSELLRAQDDAAIRGNEADQLDDADRLDTATVSRGTQPTDESEVPDERL
ncbi:MAG TPA: hypothetical protein VHZ03_49885 [Trebonia sp.]|jgi:hypothetical protein|nr:hypothetical protein [Trebonia sp.]